MEFKAQEERTPEKREQTTQQLLEGKNKSSFMPPRSNILNLPFVQTFGYVVRDQDPLPVLIIDANKATSLGVKPSRKYKLLKQDFPVQSDDGTQEIIPSHVLPSKFERRANLR